MIRMVVGVVAALLLMTANLLATDQDSPLAAARDLYASAAYEDALAVLNRITSSGRPVEEARAVEQYRAFCLLALGRTAEAERAIEALVAGEPTYRPSSDVSPRVRAAFTDVRKRVLPTIAQQLYTQAKASYDRKEYSVALAAFTMALEVMNDPDAAAAVSQPPLSDMRTLAVGFKDLAAAAAAPPPPAVAVAPPVQAPTPPKPPQVYTSADAEVVPPIPLRQDLPPFPGQVPFARQGMIEVLIDENGLVEGALMRISVTSSYDALALASARAWRFKPALLNGTPVKYRKAIQVTIKPSGPR